MDYAMTKLLAMPLDAALARVKPLLKEKGFGVLTRIDVHDTLKEKLDVDFYPYVILGVCNPPFAYKALQIEENIGLMLPCNVVLYEKDGETTLSIIRPTVAMGMIDSEELRDVATEVEGRLRWVLEQA